MEFIGSRFAQKEMLGQVCELRDACNAELARKSLSDSSGNHKLSRGGKGYSSQEVQGSAEIENARKQTKKQNKKCSKLRKLEIIRQCLQEHSLPIVIQEHSHAPTSKGYVRISRMRCCVNCLLPVAWPPANSWSLLVSSIFDSLMQFQYGQISNLNLNLNSDKKRVEIRNIFCFSILYCSRRLSVLWTWPPAAHVTTSSILCTPSSTVNGFQNRKPKHQSFDATQSRFK